MKPSTTIVSLAALCLLPLAAPAFAAEFESGREIPTRRLPGVDARNTDAQLQSYLLMGQVGVGKDGMLVVRSNDGVPARVQEEMYRAISAENTARRAQVDKAMRDKGLPEEKRGEVEKEFADRWRAAADGQSWVQDDQGRWQQGPRR